MVRQPPDHARHPPDRKSTAHHEHRQEPPPPPPTILPLVGGAANITSVAHCMTRLRLGLPTARSSRTRR